MPAGSKWIVFSSIFTHLAVVTGSLTDTDIHALTGAA
jgi:hypothetical protein